MKKIINGRKYDTETATLIGFDSYSNYRDFNHWEEWLYKKRNGEFFLYGSGGPNSKYSVRVDMNSWSGGSKIIPLTYNSAKEWAEKHLNVDEYEGAFGKIEEGQNELMVLYGDDWLYYKTHCDGVFEAFKELLYKLESIGVNVDNMKWDELTLCDANGEYLDHEEREV